MAVTKLIGGTLYYANQDVKINTSSSKGVVAFKKGHLYYEDPNLSDSDRVFIASEVFTHTFWNKKRLPLELTKNVYVKVTTEAEVDILNELRGLYADYETIPMEAESLNVNCERYRTPTSNETDQVVELSWLAFTKAMGELEKRLPKDETKKVGRISLMTPAKEVEDLEEPLIKFEGKVEGLPEKPRIIVPEPGAKVEYIKPDWAETGYKEKEGKTTYELDWGFIRQIAERMDANKGKYPRYNWQKPMEDPRDLLAAAQRHLTALHEGILEDAGRPLGHIEGAACNLMMYFAQVKIDKN